DFINELINTRQEREISQQSSILPTMSDELKEQSDVDRRGGQPVVFGTLYQPGEKIAEKYEVERILGQGATANTYLVRDEFSGERDVLKQLRDPLHARQLALNEYVALKHLHHLGIMRVFEVCPPDKEFHLRVEYVEGDSIHDLYQRGEFPWNLERV